MIAYAFLTTNLTRSFRGGSIAFTLAPVISSQICCYRGGFGATLVNIALIILVELLVIWRSKGTQTGSILTAVLTTVGYGFFGTSLFNFLPVLLGGVILYARLEKLPFNTLLLQAFMVLPLDRSSTISPLGSDSIQRWELGSASWWAL